jgi:diketogulonate reductase-like aldo/keto reductase
MKHSLLLLFFFPLRINSLSDAFQGLIDRRQAILQPLLAATTTTTSILTSTTSGPPSLVMASGSDPSTTISSNIMEKTTLSDGTLFPLVSFGLQIYDDNTAYELTMTALEVGYRNFFASILTGNQRGFSRAIRDSGIPRKDLFVCGSVVSNRAVGYRAAYDETTKGWLTNMENFASGSGGMLDYVDQMMLDYPGPDCDSIAGQWKSLEEMATQQRLTRTLAVSNFSPKQLDCIPQDSILRPVVNQLPYSVAYHTSNVIEENAKRGVLLQAWAPLGGSLGGRFSSLMKAKCGDIGLKYNKTFAQVALRWIVQTGASFTTQSHSKKHFQENLNIFDFELSDDDMKILSALA